jgi:hypothetical protein
MATHFDNPASLHVLGMANGHGVHQKEQTWAPPKTLLTCFDKIRSLLCSLLLHSSDVMIMRCSTKDAHTTRIIQYSQGAFRLNTKEGGPQRQSQQVRNQSIPGQRPMNLSSDLVLFHPFRWLPPWNRTGMTVQVLDRIWIRCHVVRDRDSNIAHHAKQFILPMAIFWYLLWIPLSRCGVPRMASSKWFQGVATVVFLLSLQTESLWPPATMMAPIGFGRKMCKSPIGVST